MWSDDALQPEGFEGGSVSSVEGINPALLISAVSPVPDSQTSQGAWIAPSIYSVDPDEARARILLPQFNGELIAQANAIAECFPFAPTECRSARESDPPLDDVSRFEKVFRVAATIANAPLNSSAYDDLIVLTAWACVRPHQDGFLGCYPKSLLCPLSHAATPEALAALPASRRIVFDRRAPVYLRYLLCSRFELRTCADLEQADLRQLLRTTGFRLVRASHVPEIAFPGITRGEDPAVRPWRLTLRQELTDDRAAEMLIQAAQWQIRYGLRLVTLEHGRPCWNIRAFSQTNWEDAFLSLGLRVAPSLTRSSGLLDWRAVLGSCLDAIGTGNLPPDLLGKVLAAQQRTSHDSEQGIWGLLDRVSEQVLERARGLEPHLFAQSGAVDHRLARGFRRWARLYDEVSPNILSRLGVTAFTALHRVAPQHFGWGLQQLKPWEVEQDFGKWKGARGRAMLRSAYAFALSEAGLGTIEYSDPAVFWRCTREQFLRWSSAREMQIGPYGFLYRLASRHGLTPLLNREISHTAMISLLAGANLHEHLPHIEGCWDICMRSALDMHRSGLEVRLDLPDLAPLPLRLRKATLAQLEYAYLHRQLRFVREFDLRMARESRRKLEEIPGWWEDERIAGTPLATRLDNPADTARKVLRKLRSEPWVETHRARFRALQLLLSNSAVAGEEPEALSRDDLRCLIELGLQTLEATNIVRVSIPAVRRGFERILAREDIREVLDSLLLHVGAAYETELWGQVRKHVVLDVINDVMALTVRSCLLHLLGGG